LLAIVWVGFDDNRDLGLSGGNAPAPIWAEFMKRALTLPAYRDVRPFEMPEGVTKVTIDPESLALATPECPVTREEVYIHGTEPTEFCPLHGGRMASDSPPGSWLSHVFGGDKAKEGDSGPAAPGSVGSGPSSTPPASADNQPAEDENKKGILRRIFGIFGGKKDADKPKSDPQDQQQH
jgi:penicillin-binding protein 1B